MSETRVADAALDDRTLHEAVFGLFERRPECSARVLLTRPQALGLAALVATLIGVAFLDLALAIVIVSLAASAFFVLAALSKAALALVGLRAAPPSPAAPAQGDELLPTITILLPVHDEKEGLPILADAMARIDYPARNLDIKLLLEKADGPTVEEAYRLGLDRRFEFVIVPDAAPKTKPKACNYGLARARGALTVIYDAEDAPEPDQLRKAAAMFARSGPGLACLQARLNFYNADENFLTRLFALEYALWFDLFLPALARLGLPIPLGGTSNIFRTDILRRVGGWDPFNVTEDADLGLRLARLGYRTAVLDSTTYEEANCRLPNWIRQRSRWMKGYMQTWLVHMRAPKEFLRATGIRGFAALQLFVAGNVFSALINPLLWILAAAWPLASGADYPQALAALNVAALVAGNLLFIALAAVAPSRRGWARLAPFALLAPAYWLLASVGAWRAFFQLFRRPSHWEKTAHTLSAAAQERRRSALGRLRAPPD